jgi:hypothetical protein
VIEAQRQEVAAGEADLEIGRDAGGDVADGLDGERALEVAAQRRQLRPERARVGDAEVAGVDDGGGQAHRHRGAGAVVAGEAAGEEHVGAGALGSAEAVAEELEVRGR